jgi:hypothetical protein
VGLGAYPIEAAIGRKDVFGNDPKTWLDGAWLNGYWDEK